jgi:hypothetical protein
MMNPFPEDWQLIGLFESEPELMYPSAQPWAYNMLRFEFHRDLDRLQCILQPGDERIEIHWWQADRLRLHLDLAGVNGLVVEITAARDALLASFREGVGFVLPLELQLRPYVSIAWGLDHLWQYAPQRR